jgi:hypothetical protein
MNFCIKGEASVPTIVTNKHVVAGADEGKIWITAKRPEAIEPDLGNLIAVPIANFVTQWVLHPNPLIDIAVFPIAPLLSFVAERGRVPFYIAFDTSALTQSDDS